MITQLKPLQSQLLSVLGGQLSYNDSSCSSPPVAVNDAWYSVIDRPLDSRADSVQHAWYQGPAAPFSPRRSMAHDAAFVHLGSIGDLSSGWLQSFTLVGGHRVTGLRSDSDSNASVLTSVDMFADVYECVLPTASASLDPLLHSNVTFCAWNDRNASAAPPLWPADSTPLPVSGAASLRANGGLGGIRIGGRTSRAAVAAWTATLPVLDDDGGDVDLREMAANISLLLSPYFGRPAQSEQDVMAARHNLSLVYRLHEDELSDPLAPFNLGSDHVVAHFQADMRHLPLLQQVSTVHNQPFAFADSPANASSWYSPQAASSLNTTRPLFNFRLRRIGHGMSLRSYWSLWGWQIISGGRSGDAYSNDWIRLSSTRCAPPDDPAYAAALGPVELLTMFNPIDGIPMMPLHQQIVSGAAQVRCAADHHWVPPLRETQLELHCAPNGMWMSLDAQTVRRCVLGLNCSWPEVDLGFEQCELPVPTIESIDVVVKDYRPISDLVRVDNVTLADVPIGLGTFIVRGRFFSLPLRVMVGGVECDLPQLWTSNDTASARLCEAVSGSERCEEYAPEVRCTLPAVWGIHLPVVVTSGFHSEQAEVANGALPTISSTPPRIAGINSSYCELAERHGGIFPSLSLINCPNDVAFNLSVRFWSFTTITQQPVTVRLATRDMLDCSQRVVAADPGLDEQVEEVVCTVAPRVGSNLPLRLFQLQESRDEATLSFAGCRPGWRTNNNAIFNASSGNPCLPCPVGHSTQNASAQSDCAPCPPGTFADSTGQAQCEPCPVGFYMPTVNASQCWPCSVNSWKPL